MLSPEPSALLLLPPKPCCPHPFPGPGKLMENTSVEELGASSKLLSFWEFCAIHCSA